MCCDPAAGLFHSRWTTSSIFAQQPGYWFSQKEYGNPACFLPQKLDNFWCIWIAETSSGRGNKLWKREGDYNSQTWPVGKHKGTSERECLAAETYCVSSSACMCVKFWMNNLYPHSIFLNFILFGMLSDKPTKRNFRGIILPNKQRKKVVLLTPFLTQSQLPCKRWTPKRWLILPQAPVQSHRQPRICAPPSLWGCVLLYWMPRRLIKSRML